MMLSCKTKNKDTDSKHCKDAKRAAFSTQNRATEAEKITAVLKTVTGANIVKQNNMEIFTNHMSKLQVVRHKQSM